MKPRRWVGVVGFILVFSTIGSVLAEDREPYVDRVLRKLGRGITNIATCPGELIYRPNVIAHKDGYLPSITIGTLQGIWHTLLRGLAGVYEVATFYVAIPRDFKPLVEPEFLFETLHREGR